MPKKIAIQGGKASFHDIAAHEYFPFEIEIIECSTFELLCEKVAKGEVDYGFMAIENSIAATILLNYQLIQNHELSIVGEHQLRIVQNLMALPGQKLDDIKKVRSHYMALRQCNDFLNTQTQMEIEEYYDTADSAKFLLKEKIRGEAAIASAKAAQLYGLEIIAPSIETIKLNFTRFLVLSKNDHNQIGSTKNKATLSFELPDKVGSLTHALEIIVKNEINLSKIQSVPLIGKPDDYTFYLECTWNYFHQMEKCIVELKTLIPELKTLGIYKKFEHHVIPNESTPSFKK
jgi:prephenate dehydratase